MPEQENAIRDEGRLAYLTLCEELVREHFTALGHTPGLSQRDAAEAGLKENMDPEKLEFHLQQIEHVLEGLWHVAAEVSPVGEMVVNDVRQRMWAALERVQEYRNTWG